jgi:GNAT superfamily N-acetyltransferase
MIVEARRTAGSDPVALELMAAMVEEMGRLYEPELARAPVAPEELSPPAGGFVVLSEGGRALAGGGVKRLDARTGEIKRMYVVPAARGRGVGRELLSALEGWRATSATRSSGSTPAPSSRARSGSTSAPGTAPCPTTTATRTPRSGARRRSRPRTARAATPAHDRVRAHAARRGARGRARRLRLMTAFVLTLLGAALAVARGDSGS